MQQPLTWAMLNESLKVILDNLAANVLDSHLPHFLFYLSVFLNGKIAKFIIFRQALSSR